MKKLTFLFTICILLFTATSTAVAQNNMNNSMNNIDVPEEMEQVIQNWPKATAKVAKMAYNRYGMPDAITERRIIWYDTGAWNITMVRKNPIPHDFPVPHKDCLYQAIFYDVPVDMYDDLARYDGSLIVEQTRGTMAARCNWVPANFVSVNIAHEIITGQISVEEARKKYGRMILKFMNGIPSPYYTEFIFEVPRDNTRDPGESVIPHEVDVDFPTKFNSDQMNNEQMDENMDNMGNMDEDQNYAADKVAKVAAAQSEMYGWYVVDSTERTLYVFMKDNRYESSDCYGQCVNAWPPFTGNPKVVADMLNEEMLGTIERRNGAMQVTYNGWPLYYYQKDQYSGEFTGQGAHGTWWMIAPDGTLIRSEGGEGNMNGDDY